MKLFYRFGSTVVGLLLAVASPCSAQLYWDGADLTADADGGAGVWDVATTPNWDTAATGGASATWTNGGNAVFPDAAANYTVSVVAGGLTVKNITLAPSAAATPASVILNAQLQNDVLTASPGAVWDANGRTLRVINDNTLNDLVVGVGAGNTLTIQNSAATAGLVSFELRGSRTAWAVQNSNATLDVVSPMSLRGGGTNVGTFGTVKLVGGSTYIHSSNNANVITNDFANYNNQFVLGTGVVTFDRQQTNANGGTYMNGVISGPGRLQVDVGEGVGDQMVLVANNTYSGGTTVKTGRLVLSTNTVLPSAATTVVESGATLSVDTDLTTKWTQAQITALASAVTFNPGSYLGLRNGTAAALTVPFGISGSQGLAADGGTIILSGSHSYAGETLADLGILTLGANNALPVGTILNVRNDASGGQFDFAGFNQTVGGLISPGAGGSGTKDIRNTGGVTSTLTINPAAGQTYVYDRNIGTTSNTFGAINVVKTGTGNQIFDRAFFGSTTGGGWTGSVAINQGGFGFDDLTSIPTGGVTVASGATIFADVGGSNGTTPDPTLEFQEAEIDTLLGGNSGGPAVAIASNSFIGFRTDSNNATTGDDFTYTGDLGTKSAAGTTLGVKKIGSGAVSLTGANTYDGSTTVSGGRLLINGDFSAANGLYTAARGGNLGGTGTLGGNLVIEAGGDVAPGPQSAAGTLNVGNHSLTMSPDIVEGANTVTSAINLNLSGTDKATGAGINDLISGVTNFVLDGSIAVFEVGTGSFGSVALNDTWTFLQYSGTLTNNGAVISSTPASLTAGLALALDTSVAGELRVKAVAAVTPIVGDYNNNGMVDAADYTIWRDNNDTAFALDNRDPANTGNVSNADYLSWRSRFGNTASVAASIASAGAVPEPRAIVMLGLLAVAGWILSCRQS